MNATQLDIALHNAEYYFYAIWIITAIASWQFYLYIGHITRYLLACTRKKYNTADCVFTVLDDTVIVLTWPFWLLFVIDEYNYKAVNTAALLLCNYKYREEL